MKGGFRPLIYSEVSKIIILNKPNIEQMIEEQIKRVSKHEAWIEDDFNPEEASGGNFDDAFHLGYEYGIDMGKLEMLRNLLLL